MDLHVILKRIMHFSSIGRVQGRNLGGNIKVRTRGPSTYFLASASHVMEMGNAAAWSLRIYINLACVW